MDLLQFIVFAFATAGLTFFFSKWIVTRWVMGCHFTLWCLTLPSFWYGHAYHQLVGCQNGLPKTGLTCPDDLSFLTNALAWVVFSQELFSFLSVFYAYYVFPVIWVVSLVFEINHRVTTRQAQKNE